MTAISELQQRFAAIDARLQAAEAIAAICIGYDSILKRITAVEQAISEATNEPSSGTSAASATEAAAAASRRAAYDAAMTDNITGGEASPIQRRLAQELFDKGFSDFRLSVSHRNTMAARYTSGSSVSRPSVWITYARASSWRTPRPIRQSRGGATATTASTTLSLCSTPLG